MVETVGQLSALQKPPRLTFGSVWRRSNVGETNRSRPWRSTLLPEMSIRDVCIVGGGPAGLSAALILGRCRRDVVVLDGGKPRNASSRGLSGYLTRDGVHPMELRELARAELRRYATVEVRDTFVIDARRKDDAFVVAAANGERLCARTLLLATGRADELPARPGFARLYGRGVYHCPFCDGWEHRDQPMAAYGRDDDAVEIALELRTWSAQLTLFTDGRSQFDERRRRKLAANGVRIVEHPVRELVPATDGFLERVRLAGGGEVPCRALFFVSDCPQRSGLPERLGCRFALSGGVLCDEHAATNVPGLYVAGNVRCGLHFAITAAAEGAEAAVAINDALLEADLR